MPSPWIGGGAEGVALLTATVEAGFSMLHLGRWSGD